MTAKELAGFLKLTEATIYKLVSSGKLPGFKIGDSWRFDMDEVMKVFRKNETQKGKNRSPASYKKVSYSSFNFVFPKHYEDYQEM